MWVSPPQANSRVSKVNLIFEFFCGEGVSINILWKIYQGRQSSFLLGVSIKGIGRIFNWLKCLGGFLPLKATAGCPISTLIFEFSFVEGGLYEYPMKNILRKSKFLPTWDLNQRYFPGLWLTQAPGLIQAPHAHSRGSNINFDIWIFFVEGGSL